MNPQTQPKKPRGLIMAGNWKMNHSKAEVVSFFSELEPFLQASPAINLPEKRAGLTSLIFPGFLSLEAALQAAKKLTRPAAGKDAVQIGSQNVHWESSGAFTGEVSAQQLKAIGIEHCLVGHSERRCYFGETSVTVGKRAQAALKAGMQVLWCIGETQAERDAGITKEVLSNQLQETWTQNLDLFKASFESGSLKIAYEPVWAIGTGKVATPEQAQEAHAFIRSQLPCAAKEVAILYGGSVTPENAHSLLTQADIDGALIGGASLKAQSYLKLLESAIQILS